MRENLLIQFKSKVQTGPLNGTIVIGFCYYVAGPIALQNLVRQGALVIKIERKPMGDPSRQVFSKPIFNSLTHGQLSVAFDYEQKADRQLLQALLGAADVIVDNRSVEAQERDPILNDYLQKINKLNPKIYCTIDGFPNSKVNRMPGLDASVQAATGFAYSNCISRLEPLKVGVPILDIVTGLLAATYIISNLMFLKQNSLCLPPEAKNVVRIAVSLAGTSMWLQANQVINALEEKEYFRKGNQDKFAAPFSYYKTKGDDWISIATVNEVQFESFCLHVLENKEFHQKYPTVQIRIELQDDFERDLNQLLKTKDKEYWLAKCQEYKIPASPVLTVSEAVRQKFFKDELIAYSSDHQPIITTGISQSLFPALKSSLAPAPQIDQDHQSLSDLLEKSKLEDTSSIRAKL